MPRYFTLQLRAREYAKQHNVQLSWCYARDVPLHPEDRDLPADALQAKLTAWLKRHDQETSHISSILPLAVGMPIRLTENVDRDRQMYRGRRGTIHGWTMRADCVPEEVGGEYLLPSLPLVIYIYMEGATWQIGKLPVGVYPLRQKARTWKVNKYTGIEAKRTGFWIIPDFCSTAHMIQGATLAAAFVDAQHSATNVSLMNQIAAYVCLSRVKKLATIFVLQAFSPLLFNRGPPEGPAKLLEKLENPEKACDILQNWINEDAVKDKDTGKPLSTKHLCTCCYLRGKADYMKHAEAFGVKSNTSFHSLIVRHGCWTRCLECQKGIKKKDTPVNSLLLEIPEPTGFCQICNEATDAWNGN